MHIGIKITLLLHDDFGAACGQPNEIETETGIERIIQGLEPLAKQAVDHLSLGRRLSGVDHNRTYRAVGAEEACFQPPRTLALLAHRRDKHVRQLR